MGVPAPYEAARHWASEGFSVWIPKRVSSWFALQSYLVLSHLATKARQDTTLGYNNKTYD